MFLRCIWRVIYCSVKRWLSVCKPDDSRNLAGCLTLFFFSRGNFDPTRKSRLSYALGNRSVYVISLLLRVGIVSRCSMVGLYNQGESFFLFKPFLLSFLISVSPFIIIELGHCHELGTAYHRHDLRSYLDEELVHHSTLILHNNFVPQATGLTAFSLLVFHSVHHYPHDPFDRCCTLPL